MKHFFFITMLITAWATHAKEIFPQGCTPYTVHGENVALSTNKPTIMMLHNLTNIKIWVTHYTSNAGAQAGWSSMLDAGKWSALALSPHKKQFKLTCIESQPGHEQPIACQDVLAVCEWENSHTPENKSGTFWAAENMEMKPLKAYLQRMGFQPN